MHTSSHDRTQGAESGHRDPHERRWTNPATGQEKLYGLVVDYVGLGNALARAVAARDTGLRKQLPADIDGLFAVLAGLITATVVPLQASIGARQATSS